MIPYPKVWTIKASFWVWNFTVNVPNLFKKFFRDSPCLCFTPKRSKEIGGGAWLTINCSLNNSKIWSKEMMWPLGRPLNHCIVVPVNVPMKHLAMDSVYSF